MKTRICLLVMSFVLATTLQAQTYNQLWKNVAEMEKKDLPQSAISEAQRIYDKAKVERNVPQMMKAYLTMMSFRGSISPDSIPADVKRLERWAAEPDVTRQDKAVLYSILGGICIRDDFEKGNRYLLLSLKDSLELVEYPADNLVPMVKSGETSRLYLNDNLYDLLARRAIQLWKQHQWRTEREIIQQTIRQTYQSLLYIYKVRNLRSAWLLTALDAYPQADEKQLYAWMEEYGDLEVCSEIYLRLAQEMQRKDEPAKGLSLLREGMNRYPKYYRIDTLKNLEREILRPWLNLVTEDVYPDNPIRIEVNHRNLSGIQFKLYQLSLPVESALLTKVDAKTVSKYGTLLRQEHFDLPKTVDYRLRKDTVALKGIETGVYYVLAVPDGYRKEEKGVLLHVTGLQVIHRTLPGGKYEMVVLNKRSGHPVPGAQISLFQEMKGGYERKESYIAGAGGEVVLEKGKDRYLCFQAQTATDKAMPMTRAWMGNHGYQVVDKTEEFVKLFTDRSVYRPGQTLQFSGIAYHQRKDWTRAKEGGVYVVALQDVDGREVAKQEVKTDAFGSFSGTFVLPKQGKMGVYRLRTNQGVTTFRIEEYKRPTFEITFDKVQAGYRAGDSLRMTGLARTFTGSPVQGALVKYQVVRLENAFWRMRGLETNRVTGETMTDDAGRFEVPVHFLPLEKGVDHGYFTYEVSADVTNLAGETQEGKISLPLGSSSFKLFIPDWEGQTLVKEQRNELLFRVSNLMDVPVNVEVDYQILSQGKSVFQGRAVSNRAFCLEEMDDLPSGYYQLKAKVKDEHGKVVEWKVAFHLISLADKHVPDGMELWSYQPDDEFGEDGIATIYLGSCLKDVYLFYDVMYGENQVERKRIVFSDSLMAFRYTYREEYGDGLRCSFAFLKDGELFERTMVVKKPKPDKALQLKWKVFRDKLQPGTKEMWTLSVVRPDGMPADAQLMATLYDASLDRLHPHAWYFGLSFVRNIPNAFWNRANLSRPYWGFTFPSHPLKCPPLTYSQLDVPGRVAMKELQMFKAATMMDGARNAMGDVSVEESLVEVSEEEGLEHVGKVQYRTNLAETAFFYSHLRTDGNGDVKIEFVLPESLTEWKFMGLAHTQDMEFGSLEDEVVARKEFMLQPNLPRFVRVGDKVNVPAVLINLSEKKVKGTVRMELLSPETERVVMTQECPFVVKAEETEKVAFDFHVTDKHEGLIVRIVADGGGFSDGEQRYLPILSNKQKLVESVLLNVNGSGTYTYSLDALFNSHSRTVSHPKMWVEFTGHPLWYAVQALKVVAAPVQGNAMSWATAYYANSLLDYLAKSEPCIADSLKVDGVEESILESLRQLEDLQDAEGAWSWYKGMSGNRYMTTQIVELMARLRQMTNGLASPLMESMYQKAFRYLSKEAEEEVKQMKEAERKGAGERWPSEQSLRYLYICALDSSLSISDEVNDYLIDRLAVGPARLSIYEKALGAIIMHRAGKHLLAKEFLQSLLEYSVVTQDMGRYFDTSKAKYSWFSYKIPTEVAAIEAVQAITNDQKTIEQMKLWLIKQKQAQVWDTPIATTNAVYALLNTGNDWLDDRGATEIVGGENVIRIPEDEALGYVRQEMKGRVEEIRTVTVKKESEGVAWGAVYAEFEEDMDKVGVQGNALQITRAMYKEGRLLKEGEVLQVGDRVNVRLSVKVDRDMDFVEVRDERAACMEPVAVLSGFRWNQRIGYYQETRDSSTVFFFDRMPKGTYELEYEVYVTSSGGYSSGIPVARSVYAPEFTGHGAGAYMHVK